VWHQVEPAEHHLLMQRHPELFSLAADTNTAIYKKGMNQAVASLLNIHTHTNIRKRREP